VINNAGSFLCQAKTASYGVLPPTRRFLRQKLGFYWGIADEPAVQIRQHLGNRFVTVLLDGSFFGQTVHPFDHSVGLGCVGQRCPMLDLLLSAELPEVMVVLDYCAPAVLEAFDLEAFDLEAFECELAPVVCQNLADLEWKERQALPQKVSGSLLILAVIDCQERQTSGSVDGDEAVALLIFYLVLPSSFGR
jgi:hypothetical protein